MKKYKVLFIAVGDKYGSGKALLCLINELLSNGHECYVVCANRMGLSSELNKMNVPNIHIPIKFAILPSLKTLSDVIRFPFRRIRNNWINFIAEKKLKKIITYWKPDIVHTNVGVYRVSNKICRKMNIPHVWHIREYQTKDMNYIPIGGIKGFVRAVKESNNYPICITHGLATFFDLAECSKIIYDGINIDLKVKKSKCTQNKYFLFVGNITKHKGCTELIEAYIQFQKEYESDIELWLAGGDTGDYANTLKKYVKKELPSGKICFLGFVNNVSELMFNSQALIVPSIYECFGLITAEAMFLRCLVIGRNTGGTKEQFDNGLQISGQEIGLRFETTLELKNHLADIYLKKIKTETYVENAYTTVSKLYTPQKNYNDIIEYYNEILN